MTETCAGSFVSIPNVMSMIGTVGPPVPHVEARLESVPDMGYDALSQVPCGEIPILLEAFKYFRNVIEKGSSYHKVTLIEQRKAKG